MAVSLPTSSDVRKVRTQANKVVNTQIDIVRTPFLAWLGAGDLAVNKVNDAVAKARTRATERREAAQARAEKLQGQLSDLPTELRDRLTTDELRKRYDDVTGQARKTYTDLADRGEGALERFRKQPQVAKVLDSVEEASSRFDKRVERAVDDVHDAGEEVLGRVSTETRSVGERTARATKRVASDTADAVSKAGDEVSKAGDELAEEVQEAGAEAAHTTRSVTRKTATRTAPRKTTTPKARNTNTNGTSK